MRIIYTVYLINAGASVPLKCRLKYRGSEVATLEVDGQVAAAQRYLERYTWSNPDHIWEEFAAPVLDMGTCQLGVSKRIKVEVYNRGLVLARISMEVMDLEPLRVPWKDCLLGPGQKVTAARWMLSHQKVMIL